MALVSAQDWPRIRAAGRGRFLFTRGVLGRGVPMALVVAVGIELMVGGPLPDSLLGSEFLGRLALALLVFGIGGALNAQMQWKLAERRFG